jgi:hypothetical protein
MTKCLRKCSSITIAVCKAENVKTTDNNTDMLSRQRFCKMMLKTHY